MMFLGDVNTIEETAGTRNTTADLKLDGKWRYHCVLWNHVLSFSLCGAGTLLVADDSAVIRKIICKYLDALLAQYVVCKDGREAADWFEVNYETCCGELMYWSPAYFFDIICRYNYGSGDAQDGRRCAHCTCQGHLCKGPMFHRVGYRTDQPASGDETVSITLVR